MAELKLIYIINKDNIIYTKYLIKLLENLDMNL